MPRRILLVDDEPGLVKGLRHSLEQEGYAVLTASDGPSGLDAAKNQKPDLVILDIMLPGLDGLSVCRELRKTSLVPVIMLTARGDDVDRIVGLEIGADDYLAKPFNTRELLARIKAVLRRVDAGRDSDVTGRIVADDLEIDPLGRRVQLGGVEIELTAREFDLLSLLAAHPGRVYSREQLLDLVWGFDFGGETRTVDVHIRRLREKIETEPERPARILTKWGVGYFYKG